MAVVTAVVVRDWWLRRWRPLRRWLWWVGGSNDAGRYDGGCGGVGDSDGGGFSSEDSDRPSR
jgi:hypothetical protein